MKSVKKDKIKRKSKLITKKKCRGKKYKRTHKITHIKKISRGKRYSRKKVKGNKNNKQSKKRVSQKKIQKGGYAIGQLANREIFGPNPPAVYNYHDNTFGFNCPVCRNADFKIKTSKLSTGKRFKEFFIGDISEVLLERKVKVFICANCGHINMFTNKIDLEYYNKASSEKRERKSEYRRGFMGRKIKRKKKKEKPIENAVFTAHNYMT